MGRITDSWSGKQKFHKGFGRKGNTKIDEYQQILLDAEANRTKGWDWKPKKSNINNIMVKKSKIVIKLY